MYSTAQSYMLNNTIASILLVKIIMQIVRLAFSDTIEMVLSIDPPYTTSHQKMINKIIIAYTGLQITNRQVLVTLSSQTRFYLDMTRFWPVKF